jgi:G3E family GTPase
VTPLVLIAGFLGAGKTTLLRAILPDLRSRGLRPHVILNDYQNARVDAASLDEHSDLVTPIDGTCVCCESQGELIRALAEAPLTPESVMLVEANGTADTTEIIEILTADRRASRYTLPIQITVVDARRWQKRGRNDGLERLQAQTARYLHLTRRDQITPERHEDVLGALRSLAPHSRAVDPSEFIGIIAALRSSVASLPPRRFAQAQPGVPEREGSNRKHPGHVHDRRTLHHFSSLEIPIRAPVNEYRLRELLESLPEEVLRSRASPASQGASIQSTSSEWRVRARLFSIGSTSRQLRLRCRADRCPTRPRLPDAGLPVARPRRGRSLGRWRIARLGAWHSTSWS